MPDKLDKFRRVRLGTLTVDPKKFDHDPLKAYEYVTKNHFISRLFTSNNGVNTWFWVLEFHESGWPHWHVLIDLSAHNGWIAYDKLVHFWLHKWQIGCVNIKDEMNDISPAHAVNYITKYLLKPSPVPPPSWFVAGSRRRMCQGSRDLGAIVFDSTGDGDDSDDVRLKRNRKQSRPIYEIVAACSSKSVLLGESVDTQTGEMKRNYLKTLNCSKDDIIRLHQAGLLSSVGDYASMGPVNEIKAAQADRCRDYERDIAMETCDFMRLGEINKPIQLSEHFKVVPVQDGDRTYFDVYLTVGDVDLINNALEQSGLIETQINNINRRASSILFAHDEYMAVKKKKEGAA